METFSTLSKHPKGIAFDCMCSCCPSCQPYTNLNESKAVTAMAYDFEVHLNWFERITVGRDLRAGRSPGHGGQQLQRRFPSGH